MIKYLIIWLAVGFPTAIIVGKTIKKGNEDD